MNTLVNIRWFTPQGLTLLLGQQVLLSHRFFKIRWIKFFSGNVITTNLLHLLLSGVPFIRSLQDIFKGKIDCTMAGWFFCEPSKPDIPKILQVFIVYRPLHCTSTKGRWYHVVSSGLLDKRSSVYQLYGEEHIFEKTNALNIQQLGLWKPKHWRLTRKQAEINKNQLKIEFHRINSLISYEEMPLMLSRLHLSNVI